MAHSTHRPGDIIGGKYRIDRILGQGGMGMVVAATHLHLEQQVALKFLLPEGLQSPETIARFGREARAVVKLKSEHVSRTIDVGELPDGAPYIVMELLAGTDLGSMLTRNGPIPVTTAVTYTLQTLEAVAEAHSHGIVHRDLKPHNLFLTVRPDGSPCIKVLDFGIAKVQPGRGEVELTHANAVLGSPAYMSPEQLRSTTNVDARADLWSLGVILYELVTGRQPFAGSCFSDICLKINLDEVPPMAVHGLPRGFETVIKKILTKDPAGRYQTAAELALALAPFVPDGKVAADRIARVLAGTGNQMASNLPMMATTGDAAPTTLAPPPTTLGGATGVALAAKPSRKRLAIFAVGIGGGVVLAVVALAAMGGGNKSTPTTAASPSSVASIDAGTPLAVTPPDAAPLAAVPDAAPRAAVTADAAPVAKPVTPVNKPPVNKPPVNKPKPPKNVYDQWD